MAAADGDLIGAALRFDPLGEAERLTGDSYKTDPATMALGIGLLMESGARKSQLLESNDDTRFSIDFDEARRIFASLGFRELVEIPTVSQYSPSEAMTFIVAWSNDGVLMDFDSFDGRLNSGKIHYNWRPNRKLEDRWSFMSSGRWRADGILVGDHDIREGLRHTLGRMRSVGEFLSPWVEQPFLWLNPHHEDDYKSATASVLAMLPADVRTAVGAVS